MSAADAEPLEGGRGADDHDGGLLDSTRDDNELLSAFRSALIEVNRGRKTNGELSTSARRYGFEPNSRTTMHNVQTSTRLQSEAAVRAYVAAATRNDSVEIERFARWRNDLANQIGPRPRADAALQEDPKTDVGARRSRRTRDLVIAGCTAIVTAGITVAVTSTVTGPDDSGPADTAAAPGDVFTGVDPLESGCADGAIRANASVPAPPMNVVVVFSQACNAVWGKIERLDGAGTGDSITVVVYRLDDPSGPDTQRVTEQNVGNAYTPAIVRVDGGSPICVDGSVTVDDGARIIEAAEPQCT